MNWNRTITKLSKLRSQSFLKLVWKVPQTKFEKGLVHGVLSKCSKPAHAGQRIVLVWDFSRVANYYGGKYNALRNEVRLCALMFKNLRRIFPSGRSVTFFFVKKNLGISVHWRRAVANTGLFLFVLITTNMTEIIVFIAFRSRFILTGVLHRHCFNIQGCFLNNFIFLHHLPSESIQVCYSCLQGLVFCSSHFILLSSILTLTLY